MLFQTIVNILTKILLFGGLWSTKKFKFVYNMYTILLHSVFSYAFVFFMFAEVKEIDSLDKGTTLFYICLTEFCYLAKITTIYFKHQSIKTWMNEYSSKFSNLISDEIEVSNRKAKTIKNIIYIYYGLSLSALVSSSFTPFLTNYTTLPFPAWYPLDWQHKTLDFIIVYLYQFIGMSVNCFLNVTSDIFFIICMCHIDIYMCIIQKRIECCFRKSYKDPQRAIKCLIHIIDDHNKIIK